MPCTLHLPKFSKRPEPHHVEAKPFESGLHVWKCRACPATLPDERNMPSPVLCPHCHEVMDWTPIRRK